MELGIQDPCCGWGWPRRHPRASQAQQDSSEWQERGKKEGRGVKEEDRSQALGQQVSVWRQGMTDASVSVPTVATLWEQRRCLPPPPPTASSPLDRPWCGDNKTGAVLSAVKWPHWHSTTCGWGRGDGEVQASAQGLRSGSGGGGYIDGGQHVRTREGLSLWAVAASWDTGSVAVLPARKADVFTRGCAKFSEQPSAAWRSGLS